MMWYGAVTLCALGLAAAQSLVQPQMKFGWKQLDFTWPSPADREAAVQAGTFVQANNLPLGLAKWNEKLFITVPKWKNGVASTLNYVTVGGAADQPLQPYPSLKDNLIPDAAKELPSNSSLVSVFRIYIDDCDRLWAMDTGLADILGSPNQIAGPSIVVFDLKTDTLLHRYFLKVDDMKDDSFFANLIVDVQPDRCEDAFAYVPDLGAYGVVVYSLRENKSWRVAHHYFHFEPLAGEYNVNGVEFHWTDGVFALALSPLRQDGYRTMFFHALSSTKEFCVSTAILQNYTRIDKEEVFHDFKLLGDRGALSQSSASYYDPRTNVLFYTQVNRDGVGCWNTAKPYAPETNPLIISDSNTMEFPNDIKVDSEGLLWILTDKMPRFIYKELNPEEINYRIFSIPTVEAIKGSACA